MTFEINPFNFERLSSGNVLITNDLGFFHLLNSGDELLELIKKEHSDPNLIRPLKQKHFIRDECVDAGIYRNLCASSLSYRIQSGLCRPFLFMVVPTLRCDHDCNYCQVSRVHQNKQGYDLEIEKIPKIIEVIEKYGRPPYKIEFQGGEPLLRFDFIVEFVSKFIEMVGIDNAEFVIATSLSLMSDEIIEWASDPNNKRVSFSISLDGTRVVHDQNRKLSISSSHVKLSYAVKKLEMSLGDKRIGTVTTVTKELLDNPSNILDAHLDLGLKNVFLRPLQPYGFANKTHGMFYSVDEYLKFYRAVLEFIIYENDKYPMIEHTALVHLLKIFRSGYNGYVDLKSPSGNFLGAMIFNYDGNILSSDEARMIFKMHAVSELSLGKLGEGVNVDKNQMLIEMLSSSFISESPGCQECAYVNYCGSDTMHHLATQADYIGDKSISKFCQYQKGTFGILFDLMRDKKAMTVFESWLNG